jgi:chaperone required for assembly of F1-ATPase
MSLTETQNYVAQNTAEVVALLSEFAQTDVLLFWHPKAEINAVQQQNWQPVLDKINRSLNSVFKSSSGINILPQNKTSAQIFAQALKGLPINDLTAVYVAALNLKSPLLAYALAQKIITPDEAFSLAFLEELYQNKEWGEDAEALQRRAQIKAEIKQVGEYLNEQMSSC